MQQEYITKAEVLKAIAEVSDIDYEKTLISFDYCFVTKDGRDYQTPNFHFFVRALVEHANAKLNIEECFELPFATLLSVSEETTEEVKEKAANKKEGVKVEVVEETAKEEEIKEAPKARGRAAKAK